MSFACYDIGGANAVHTVSAIEGALGLRCVIVAIQSSNLTGLHVFYSASVEWSETAFFFPVYLNMKSCSLFFLASSHNLSAYLLEST